MTNPIDFSYLIQTLKDTYIEEQKYSLIDWINIFQRNHQGRLQSTLSLEDNRDIINLASTVFYSYRSINLNTIFTLSKYLLCCVSEEDLFMLTGIENLYALPQDQEELLILNLHLLADELHALLTKTEDMLNYIP